ncbi:hypothetical protein AB0F30_33920, partial [Streptomyces sp. NPDC029006]|uniref:hypothetical protein n=1 Tax=Streptomyces sp. NPDC029006 TaxID=3155467 RepID=UPI0033EE82D0
GPGTAEVARALAALHEGWDGHRGGGPGCTAESLGRLLSDTPSITQYQLFPPVYRNRTRAVEAPIGTLRVTFSTREGTSVVYVFTVTGAAPSQETSTSPFCGDSWR